MKKTFKGFRGKNILCGLCLVLSTTLLTWYGSFIFLGEPEIPDCLKEE
jgi:hypothetical protein